MLCDVYATALSNDIYAIRTKDNSVTRKDILDAAHELARRLSDDGAKGRPYLVPFDNPIDYFISILALNLAGAIAVPCRQDALADADYIKKLVAPKGVLHPGGRIEPIGEGRNDLPGDIVLLTTGSTGAPKGVVLTFGQVIMNCALAGDRIGIRECDYWCVEVDLSFTSGLCHMLMAWINQVPLYHTKDIEGDALNDIFAAHKSGFGGSPIQLSKLCDLLKDKAAPTKVMSSGDFLPMSYVEKILSRFPNTQINRFYGLTELSGRFCSLPHQLILSAPNSVGLPLPGFEVEIRDEDGALCTAGTIGDVWAKSPLLMQGYIRVGQDFEDVGANNDGWFNTNDKGSLSENGLITLMGREHDVFKVGGEKVSRTEIEATLSKFITTEFVVLPVEHPSFGVMPVLFAERGDGLPDWQDIRSFAFANLEAKFVPMQGFVMDELPRTNTGKIIRKALTDDTDMFERL
ncbi:acyl--CoA ligase [Hellea sp.]|nr:acyl--CoA ligase [Hellea sp.]